MTKEELQKVPFHFVSHLSMGNVHISTYIAENKRIGFSDHVKYRNGQPTNRCYRVWMLDGETYENSTEFLEALKDVNFETKIVKIK